MVAIQTPQLGTIAIGGTATATRLSLALAISGLCASVLLAVSLTLLSGLWSS